MTRFAIVGAVVVVAAIALLHPAPRPAPIATAAPSFATLSRRAHPRADARTAALVVYVVGAIGHAGLYRLSPGSRADDAIRRAGGLLPDADPAGVNLAERIEDGEEIRVPRVGETATARPSHRSPRRRRKRLDSQALDAASVDVNHADAPTLAALPGIGEALAERIVEFRMINGPFASLDELLDVSGMTQRRVDAIVPLLRLGPR